MSKALVKPKDTKERTFTQQELDAVSRHQDLVIQGRGMAAGKTPNPKSKRRRALETE